MNSASIKELAKKYPIPIISLFVIVVTGAAYLYRASAVTELKSQCEDASRDVEKYLTNIANSAQLDEQLKQLAAANEEISARLVDPQNLAMILQYFYKLEAESGVKLLGTRPTGALQKSAALKGGYKIAQYDVSLQGSFPKVLTFLRKLEQGSCYCRITTANVRPTNEAADRKEVTEIAISLTVEILGKG
ncbi:MAG: hypothetical protein QM790_18745 [Nibricoccus sp.]